MQTTETLAAALGLKPASIRHRVCVDGSYFGILPTKLPNGRLLWPADAVQRLAATPTKPRKQRDTATAGEAA